VFAEERIETTGNRSTLLTGGLDMAAMVECPKDVSRPAAYSTNDMLS